jgi:hypothetical protein
VPMVKGTGEPWDAGVVLEVLDWRYVMTRPAPSDWENEWGYLEIALRNPYPVGIRVGWPMCSLWYWGWSAWSDQLQMVHGLHDAFYQCYLPPDYPDPYHYCEVVVIPPYGKAIVQWNVYGFRELIELHPVGQIANY